LDEDEKLGYEQLQQIHRNAQATSILLSSLEKDEFDRVNGLEKAKDIWDTLQRAHEGTKPVKKVKIQLVEGQLDRFLMLDDESPQEMFNWVKRLINRIRACKSRRWSDWRMIQRMLRAYAIKDTTVTSLIQQDPTFKKMTPDDVLGRIINHDMLIKEVNHVKIFSKDITSSRKQDIAFKVSKKGKSKRAVEESSSEEEEYDDEESTKYDPEEMALFIRRFSKLMNKQKFFKGDKKDKLRTRTKRACYNCGKYGHFIANCPYERRDDEDDKKKKKKEKSYKKDKSYKNKPYGEAYIDKVWDSDDESSDSDSDGVATVAIKGSSSSSSKSLFLNLNNEKHTFLMTKESRRKVKPKTTPTKYVSSDDKIDSSDDDEESLLSDMRKKSKSKDQGVFI
jgi:hypothetical protein